MSRAGPEDPVAEVLAAHEAFYAAVEAGDIDGLRRVWIEEGSMCVHPGTAPIHGTAAVLRSWSLVMASIDYIQFFLTDVQVTLSGDRAVVTCTENVLTGDEKETVAGFRGGRARAVNVFTRTPDGWRMWIHQASQVGSGAA